MRQCGWLLERFVDFCLLGLGFERAMLEEDFAKR
jgi:hypothetical protein